MNFYFLEFCDKKRGIMWAVGFRDHATDNQFFDESWKWKFLSRVLLFATLWTVQSMGFSKPGYWSGQPFPSSGDHPNPGIKLMSPTLQADSLPSEPAGKQRRLGWVAYPFSSGSSQLRNRTRVSCITSGLFTNWAIRKAHICVWGDTIITLHHRWNPEDTREVEESTDMKEADQPDFF